MDKFCDCNQDRLPCTCKDQVDDGLVPMTVDQINSVINKDAKKSLAVNHYTNMAAEAADLARITAERDALQVLLTERDQRVDDLYGLLKKLLMAMTRTLEAGRDRIVSLGDDCDSVERMLDSDPTVSEVRIALADLEILKKCQFPQSCSSACGCKP